MILHNGVHKIQVINGAVKHIEGEGCFDRLPLLINYLKTCNVKDQTIYVNLHDNVIPTDEFITWGFSCKKEHKDHPNLRLFPNLYAMYNFRGQLNVAKQDKFTFSTKPYRKAIFCGQPTGEYSINRNTRCQFCLNTKDNKDVLGLLTSSVQIDPSQLEHLRNCMGRPIKLDAQMMFAYQVNIDGNTTSWDRLPWQMASNSLVFNHSNNSHWEWWYSELKDGYNTVFCDHDNISDKIRYYETHKDEADVIIQNAHKIVENYFSGDKIREYVERELNK